MKVVAAQHPGTMAASAISSTSLVGPSEAAKAEVKSKACAVCEEQPREILYRSEHSVLIWGAGSSGAATKVGHIMVCPRRHAAEIGDLGPAETVDLLRCCSLAARSAYSAWYTASSWKVDREGPKVRTVLCNEDGMHESSCFARNSQRPAGLALGTRATMLYA